MRQEQFTIGDLLPIAMTIVVAGIGIAFGLNVLEDIQTDMDNTSEAYTAVGDTVTAVAKFSTKLGIIVTVVVAAILIGILVRYLMVRFG